MHKIILYLKTENIIKKSLILSLSKAQFKKKLYCKYILKYKYNNVEEKLCRELQLQHALHNTNLNSINKSEKCIFFITQKMKQ